MTTAGFMFCPSSPSSSVASYKSSKSGRSLGLPKTGDDDDAIDTGEGESFHAEASGMDGWP